MKRAIYVYLLVLLAIAVAGCNDNAGESDHRPVVTVSIPPQAWVLKAIAGDSIQLNTLLTIGSNPEMFEPGVNSIKSASESDLLFLSGNLGFEEKLSERLQANNQQLKIVDTSAGITPIYGTHSHGDHVHSVADPHTWTSVVNVKVIARNMLSALVEMDPDNEKFYTDRARVLDQKLDSLNATISARLSQSGVRSFLVWHPSLSYFARDYGLEQISLGREGSESTVTGIKKVIDSSSTRGATVLFMQAEFDSSRAQSLVSETGARLVTINPLDPDWESQINIIADALSEY